MKSIALAMGVGMLLVIYLLTASDMARESSVINTRDSFSSNVSENVPNDVSEDDFKMKNYSIPGGKQLFISVITTKPLPATRNLISATWGSPDLGDINSLTRKNGSAVRVEIVGSNSETSFPGFEKAGCDHDGYAKVGVCCKTERSFTLGYKMAPDYAWYARCSDDSFVFVDNMVKQLQMYNPSEKILAGRIGYVGDLRIAPHKFSRKTLHVAGGSCMVMSNALAREFAEVGEDYENECLHDDSDLGAFVWRRFRVLPVELRGIFQYPKLGGDFGFLRPENIKTCRDEHIGRQFFTKPADFGEVYPYFFHKLSEVSAFHVNIPTLPIVVQRLVDLRKNGLHTDDIYLGIDFTELPFFWPNHPISLPTIACRKDRKSAIDAMRHSYKFN